MASNGNTACPDCISSPLFAQALADARLTLQPVPLPGAALLLLFGLAGIGAVRRRPAG